MNSAIYLGKVRHRRFVPRRHDFNYELVQWWFALDELEQVNRQSRWLSTGDRFAPLSFRPQDYLRGLWKPESATLTEAVIAKMSALAETPLAGKVYFLGNIRCWGMFFSPLNCYFLQQEDGSYSHMMAEVSNTPWLERHYYLVDLANQKPTDKAFHVSPFNPMDMRYQWKIKQPGKAQFVHIEAHREEREFDATLLLSRVELNQEHIKSVLRKHPVMTLSIVTGIYWQALKLFIKKVPFYGHPPAKK
ncbi:DUF1365 domain-containing protein [Aliidiomarina minuta]|uniref:DUF1365 domain-containing protein n=1 Tax=Aliidiomarina minuta TaxID=880057 RepID=A0A432W6A4_9GAMM|nr:DUF1365 domain-containing protein [Aliidiomarina minuta]RUO25600.1 DUF1365 domain-containing protein [Aliidiomarina minuta]